MGSSSTVPEPAHFTNAPRYIHRFSRTERTLHWVHAAAFFVLLGSGLVLYLPSLSALVGRRPFVKDVHFDTGLAWMVAIALVVALGDRRGINRAGYFLLPMDETLAMVALDLGGRPVLVYKDLVKVRLGGDLQTELVEDFFGGFVNHAGANLHAKVLYGRSNHHKIEAIFKCFARAMRYACSTDQRLKDQLPSTKGLL